jgi:Fe-S-cluster containining protein
MENICENCGECCLETEMILSQQDINLIVEKYPNGIRKRNFAFKNKDGNFQMNNVDGHCVFFDFPTKKCKIYASRPQGCRFYPLIYDFQRRDCIMDTDCPRTHLFYQNKKILLKTCEKLRHFLKFQLNFKLD